MLTGIKQEGINKECRAGGKKVTLKNKQQMEDMPVMAWKNVELSAARIKLKGTAKMFPFIAAQDTL